MAAFTELFSVEGNFAQGDFNGRRKLCLVEWPTTATSADLKVAMQQVYFVNFGACVAQPGSDEVFYCDENTADPITVGTDGTITLKRAAASPTSALRQYIEVIGI